MKVEKDSGGCKAKSAFFEDQDSQVGSPKYIDHLLRPHRSWSFKFQFCDWEDLVFDRTIVKSTVVEDYQLICGRFFTLVINWHYLLTALSHPNFIYTKVLESWCKPNRSRSSHLTQTILVNGCALFTQQSTCWACSSGHISSDGNVFISLNNLSLLMNLYEITPPPVRALCIYWVKTLLIEVLLSGCQIHTEGSRHWCWLSLLFPFLASWGEFIDLCGTIEKKTRKRYFSYHPEFLIAGRFHAACTSMPSFASSPAWEASDALWSALCSSLSTLASR